ncbi:ATP-binding cassette domain-containing protein [Rhizobium grahamii]|uniref:Thiamine ABC transporter ATP-binding protein n=1 Tax=Rhizobium grahamii TaxID=1120045 RepID=A0A370KMD0_9HYPH|nr:ATP-binding cassette domain-containing protein [Rhizobium grahamii]RDJ09694.1 thiamine ABC transporter ATP-binding protein [Rhizobium grahamii]
MVDPRFSVEMRDVGLQLGVQEFHFDCRLPAGAVIAVTGASGAGKSTFLNLLAGFDVAERGQIVIAGKDVTSEYPARRAVSLVFQDNNLFAHLDVFTNIGLGINPSMKLTTADRQSITSSLEKVGLRGFERRMPGTLSGGERQRVAFARALVRNRPVLLLDEPFAALDPGLRSGMAALLLDMHRETSNTVVVVSHDPDEVKHIADFGLFIENGMIAVAAPIDEFMGRQDHPGLTQFLRS